MKALLGRPVMGTNLTIGCALATIWIAPGIWALFAIAYVAMPS